jgi:hypothetical protein
VAHAPPPHRLARSKLERRVSSVECRAFSVFCRAVPCARRLHRTHGQPNRERCNTLPHAKCPHAGLKRIVHNRSGCRSGQRHAAVLDNSFSESVPPTATAYRKSTVAPSPHRLACASTRATVTPSTRSRRGFRSPCGSA